jgi:hypothetical protein
MFMSSRAAKLGSPVLPTGQIAEIARDTLRREFRTIDPGEAVILLIEANDRVLGRRDFACRPP